jgi:hypothetical protein
VQDLYPNDTSSIDINDEKIKEILLEITQDSFDYKKNYGYLHAIYNQDSALTCIARFEKDAIQATKIKKEILDCLEEDYNSRLFSSIEAAFRYIENKKPGLAIPPYLELMTYKFIENTDPKQYADMAHNLGYCYYMKENFHFAQQYFQLAINTYNILPCKDKKEIKHLEFLVKKLNEIIGDPDSTNSIIVEIEARLPNKTLSSPVTPSKKRNKGANFIVGNSRPQTYYGDSLTPQKTKQLKNPNQRPNRHAFYPLPVAPTHPQTSTNHPPADLRGISDAENLLIKAINAAKNSLRFAEENSHPDSYASQQEAEKYLEEACQLTHQIESQSAQKLQEFDPVVIQEKNKINTLINTIHEISQKKTCSKDEALKLITCHMEVSYLYAKRNENRTSNTHKKYTISALASACRNIFEAQNLTYNYQLKF